MTTLDGTWTVRRVSGALPPMYSVQKRISGRRGTTNVGRMPALQFDVDGLTLRYRFPFAGLVDHLEPEGEGFRGRSTLYGRELGRFVMQPVTIAKGVHVASQQLKNQLVKHIDDAIAMEQNVLRMLDSMIQTTDDAEIKEALRNHKHETERQNDRLMERLEAHGATPSMVKEGAGVLGALMKSVVDMARGEKSGRNARDGYATEHMEIAAYELLERVATRAGDEETAEVARQNRGEEEAMAKTFAANWDKFAELSLKEEGIAV